MEGTKKAEQDRKSENTQHKLSKDVFTLQMQVTMANKPDGHCVIVKQLIYIYVSMYLYTQ